MYRCLDTCQGDSGGPLMALVNHGWVLAGITSYGYQCAVAGSPGVYTHVSYFIPYIQSIIGTNETTPSTTSEISTRTSLAMSTEPIINSARSTWNVRANLLSETCFIVIMYLTIISYHS
jgi:secreted trypsin-like serine protease